MHVPPSAAQGWAENPSIQRQEAPSLTNSYCSLALPYSAGKIATYQAAVHPYVRFLLATKLKHLFSFKRGTSLNRENIHLTSHTKVDHALMFHITFYLETYHFFPNTHQQKKTWNA